MKSKFVIAAEASLGSVLPSALAPGFQKYARPSQECHLRPTIECSPLLDLHTLTAEQHADLRSGKAAVEAFWRAVQADPFWASEGQWPMGRCILGALTVQDILRATGHNVSVIPVGLQLVRAYRDKKLNMLTVGEPNAPPIRNGWNAHMVVKIGDILLDPTSGQIQRSWNAAPDAAALLFAKSRVAKTSLEELGNANTLAEYQSTLDDFDFRMTYFKLTRSVVRRTRNWGTTADANPERRAKLVEAAVRRLLIENHP